MRIIEWKSGDFTSKSVVSSMILALLMRYAHFEWRVVSGVVAWEMGPKTRSRRQKKTLSAVNSTSIFDHAALISTSPTVQRALVSCHRELGTSCPNFAWRREVSVDRDDGISSFPHEQTITVERTATRRLTAPSETQWGGGKTLSIRQIDQQLRQRFVQLYSVCHIKFQLSIVQKQEKKMLLPNILIKNNCKA